tara:strand:+ start:84869 stop:85363 length:495 start_codon:yes stop_codon:yes gene_type:complete
MKKLFIFLSLIFISYSSLSQEVSTYYLIRHAEKLRIDKQENNPKLNIDGIKRAESWKEVFSKVKFDAIYSTDYIRTISTAKPISEKQKLPILLYNTSEMYSKNFQKNTLGKTVLVVGHSNTTNVFANKILGIKKYSEINDRNNANLYIVTKVGDKATSILLKIN